MQGLIGFGCVVVVGGKLQGVWAVAHNTGGVLGGKQSHRSTHPVKVRAQYSSPVGLTSTIQSQPAVQAGSGTGVVVVLPAQSQPAGVVLVVVLPLGVVVVLVWPHSGSRFCCGAQ